LKPILLPFEVLALSRSCKPLLLPSRPRPRGVPPLAGHPSRRATRPPSGPRFLPQEGAPTSAARPVRLDPSLAGPEWLPSALASAVGHGETAGQ